MFDKKKKKERKEQTTHIREFLRFVINTFIIVVSFFFINFVVC